MVSNTNPQTGIRYGIVSANSLWPEVVDEIQMTGTDVHWTDYMAEIRAEVLADSSYLPEDKEDEIESRIELAGDRWMDDEPVHEFDMEGVKGRTTWLGGALMVWVFESPFLGTFRLCSPCVPNCCDLDTPDPEGCEGYDVPADWRIPLQGE